MRSALIVATNAYRDERLRQLRAPAHDAAALAEVLSDDNRGGFEVDVLDDVDETMLRRRVASFFRQRARDDLLLLHFSCHGVKNEHGDLYFAAVDTDLDNLEATALSSSFVNELMSRSLSRRIVLLLDCCYSGAFGRAALARGADGVDLKERFDGRGRVVLTASTSMEYAFEGLDIVGEGTPSVFSAAVADGIRTGAADRDGDGEITVEELYDHVYDTVRVESPSQTPSKWSFDVQGDFLIAKSNAVLDPFRVLPHELTGAVQSPLAHVRESAVTVLFGIMSGYHSAKERRAANSLLELLAQDDSRKVSMAAEAALSDAPSVKEDDRAAPADPPASHVPAQPSERTPAVPSPPPPRSVLPDAEPRQAPEDSVRATARTMPKPAHDLNRYGRAAALAGASLLVVACLVVGDGIFTTSHIGSLPWVLPMSASFSVGVISLIGMLTLSKDVRWRRTLFYFATTAGLIVFLLLAGMLWVGIPRHEAISLLIASVLLLVGSLRVLRTDLRESENAESHFGTRTVVALLTATGGVLLAVSLALPVSASGNFFVFRDDYWSDTYTPLLGEAVLWRTFAAYAALAVLAIGVSIWLLFWHPESPDVACGILAAIAALASIFAFLVLRPGLSDSSLTIGSLLLSLAAVGFSIAAVMAFRAMRHLDVANDASPTAANAPI